MKRLLEVFGPLFAGFHAFGHLANLVALGALGSWIVDHWIPATRKFWSWLFLKVQFLELDLTDPDKDALTGAVFFAPLIFATLIRLFSRDRDPREDRRIDELLLLPALLLGICLLGLVSKQLISDAITLGIRWQENQGEAMRWVDSLVPTHLLQLLGLIGSTIGVYKWWIQRKKRRYKVRPELGQYDALMKQLVRQKRDRAVELLRRRIERRALLPGMDLNGERHHPREVKWWEYLYGTLGLVIALLPASFSAWLSLGSIGTLRASCLLLTIVTILLTARFYPMRILQIGAVVLALVAASYVLDFILSIQKAVET